MCSGRWRWSNAWPVEWASACPVCACSTPRAATSNSCASVAKGRFFRYAMWSGRWSLAKLNVKVGDLQLRNPVMPASGCFAIEYSEALDFNQLGALVIKSVSPKSRAGNPTPRVAETPSGMLNSIGIPSKGLDYYRREVLPPYTRYDTPVVVSISADTVDEFARAVAEMSLPEVAVIEANISCPNLEARSEERRVGKECRWAR